MSHPKRGDVVLYSQGGKTYNALVLAAHSLNDSHVGKNGEPLLHLSVLFDDLPGVTRQPGSLPEPTSVHDVVHASHEFSQQYMESHGLRKAAKDDVNRVAAEAEIRNRRGAGEWREVLRYPDHASTCLLNHVFGGTSVVDAGEGDMGRGTLRMECTCGKDASQPASVE